MCVRTQEIILDTFWKKIIKVIFVDNSAVNAVAKWVTEGLISNICPEFRTEHFGIGKMVLTSYPIPENVVLANCQKLK